MKTIPAPLSTSSLRIAAGLAAVALAALPAYASAQSLDQLKGLVGGGGGSSSGGGGGMSLPSLSSMNSSSLGNATGIVSFCIKNNYLGGNSATSMKDKLLGKLSGGSEEKAQQNPDYSSGLQGLLKTGGEKTVDLSGGGLKEKLTKQVCDKVLSQAKSFL